MNIFFDMDGVLSNFEKTFVARLGIIPLSQEKVRGHLYQLAMQKLCLTDFFEEIDVSPHIHDMLAAMIHLRQKRNHSVNILTATGNWLGKHHSISRQKISWLEKNVPFYFDNICISQLPSHKRFMGNKDSLLIDDSESNCAEFSRNGGTSFLYHFDRHKEFMEFIVNV